MTENLKTMMKDAKVKQWQVAKQMGVSEFTFCRWLREELPPERHAQVMAAIDELKKEAM